MLNPLMRCRRAHRGDARRDRPKIGRAAASARGAPPARRGRHPDPAVAERYPFQLSGGMRQRVALAAALARDPELLIADEPSTALDVTTQAEILRAPQVACRRARGMGLILITHDLRVAFSICDRVYVLYAGSLVEVGEAPSARARAAPPYTLGLLLSEPPAESACRRLIAIRARSPAPTTSPAGARSRPLRWASRTCRAAQAAARRGGAGPVVGLHSANRRDPRRDGRGAQPALRAVAGPPRRSREPATASSRHRPAQDLPGRRGQPGARAEGVSIVDRTRRERRSRGRVGFGQDDARALPRRARDADGRVDRDRRDRRRGLRDGCPARTAAGFAAPSRWSSRIRTRPSTRARRSAPRCSEALRVNGFARDRADAARATSCSSASACPRTMRERRPSRCPAASASASRSPARSPWSRSCSSATSRSRRSTSRSRRRS